VAGMLRNRWPEWSGIRTQVQIAALASGQIDALFTLEPIGSIALSKGVAKSIVTGPLNIIMDPLPGGAYALSSNFLEKNPKVSKKIISAMNNSLDYISKNESDAKRSLPKWTPISENLAQKINVILYWKLDEINNEAMQQLADLLYQEKNLFKEIDTNTLYITEDELR
jgi:NitT/TauT family transport system substrate-binding protein